MTAQNLTAPTRRAVTHLNLSESFGPTIQGEGPHAGALASFVRLSGCNLTCSWCDSPYTWDWTRYDHSAETHPTTLADVVDRIEALPGRIIITGGEPLLQAPALAEVMALLPERDFDLETNGTRALGATRGRWSSITCSPKIIPSADQGPMAHNLHPTVLADRVSIFKFVVQDQADLDAVDKAVVFYDLPPHRVWLMPEGITPDALTARTPFVIQAAVNRGYNFTSRLHVYGWHDVRGH